MKKLLVIIVFNLLLLFSLTACLDNSENGNNDIIYSEDWSYDEEGHYHKPVNDDSAPIKDYAEHEFKDIEVEVEPTCESEGKMTSICNICGYEKVKVLEKVDHQMIYEQNESTHIGKCKFCGEILETEEPHQMVVIEEEINCDRIYSKKICEICNYEQIIDELGTGHVINGFGYSVMPTMEKGGVAGLKCEKCGNLVTSTEIPAIKNWSVNIVKPTCTTDGVKKYDHFVSVSYNGIYYPIISTYEEPIKKLDHNYGEYVMGKEPTLTEEGYLIRYCQNDNSHIDKLTLKPLNEVDYNIDVISSPSCLTTGKAKYSFKYDEKTFEILTNLPALGHDYVEYITKPTCLEGGNSKFECSRCNDTYWANYKDALGHDFTTFEVIEEPTCSSNGTNISICKNCGLEQEQKIAAYGHNFNSENICINCGFSLEYEDYFIYELSPDNESYIITGFKDVDLSNITNLVIPAYHQGDDGLILKVSGINFIISNYVAELEDLVIYDIDSIGNDTFKNLHINKLEIYKVNEILNNAFRNAEINNFVLMDAPKSIMNDAFYGTNIINLYYYGDLSGLLEIELIDKNSNILAATKNFYLDDEITSDLIIPTNVNVVKKYTLAEINFDSITILGKIDIEEYAFAYSNVKNIYINEVSNINSRVFYNMPNLFSVTIDKTADICEYAFSNCNNLNEIKINKSIGNIYKNAFFDLENLLKLLLPAEVTSIENGAIDGCINLVELSIPYIGYNINESENAHFTNIFSSDSRYYSVNLCDYYLSGNNSPAYKGEKGYLPRTLNEITVYGGVLNSFQFAQMKSISILRIGKNVTKISDKVATDSTGIAFIHLMEGLDEKIVNNFNPKDIYAIANETGYELLNVDSDIKISKKYYKYEPYDINTIKGMYIDGILHIVGFVSDGYTVTLPVISENVIYIKPDILKYYSELKTLIIENNYIKNLDQLESPSYYPHLEEVYYNYSLESWLMSNPLRNFINYLYVDKVYIDGEYITDVTVPEGITRLEFGSLTLDQFNSITIPATVTEIANGAISIQNGGSIHYEGSFTDWVSNENFLSSICDDYYLYCEGKVITGDVAIPDGVVYLRENALNNIHGVTSVTLPASLKTIAHNAINGVSIKTINYLGTMNDYFYLEISDINSNYNRATIYINGEEPTEVDIPNWMSEIKKGQFYYFDKIKTIRIPTNIESIGNAAFYSGTIYYDGTLDDWLNIKFNGSVVSKNYNLYIDGNLLEEVVLNDEVIDDYTLASVASIKKVTISSNVKTIGDYVMSSCNNIYMIDMSQANILECGFYLFSSVSPLLIQFPENCDNLRLYEIDYSNLIDASNVPSSLNLSNSNYYLNGNLEGVIEIVNDFVTYTINDKNYIIRYIGDSNEIRIPNDKAYEMLGNIFVQLIEERTIYVSNNIDKIVGDVFYNVAFSKIYFEFDATTLYEICEFEPHHDLSIFEEIYVLDEQNKYILLEELHIPENTTVLKPFLSNSLLLKKVYLPNNIIEINSNSFNYSYLTVYYDGLASEWKLINKNGVYFNAVYVKDENGEYILYK